MKNKKFINQNKKAHDSLFKIYNLKHPEIYNVYEQNRLKKLVQDIVRLSDVKNPKILDIGAGTGNLSLKFLKIGYKVTALDVSLKSLKLLRKLSNYNKQLNLSLVKSHNLPFDSNSFDIVCIYSVLHHIPDYFHTIKEMIRVAKPGKLIYIDHEVNKNKFFPDKNLQKYYNFTRQTFFEHLIKLVKTREIFTFDFYKGAFIKLFLNKKYQREGDIHVWHDDHIEWDKIHELFISQNCELLKEEDYLLYRPKGGLNFFKKYSNLCNDTKMIIYRKGN